MNKDRKKILIIQLARLGDIFQTAPTINALKCNGAEVHLLVRERFAEAALALELHDQLFTLQSKKIITPLVSDNPNFESSLETLKGLIQMLRLQNYDLIINLSFSPLSSYLTAAVSEAKISVRGYTRHTDGYFTITDDASSYFYAQVGKEKRNQIHCIDIMSQVAGVDLSARDREIKIQTNKENAIAIHIGASQFQKTFSVDKWSQVIRKLIKADLADKIYLIGSESERSSAEIMCANIVSIKLVNQVGKTKLKDLFTLIASVKYLIGGDSAPIHIASLVNTPVYNISLGGVSAWETGPTSTGSAVLEMTDENQYSSDQIANDFNLFIKSEAQIARPINVELNTWEWKLNRAIYLNGDFPNIETLEQGMAFQRLYEANSIAIEQIQKMLQFSHNAPLIESCKGILARLDEVFASIEGWVPEVGPLLDWFRTERIRIPPGNFEKVAEETRQAHIKLHDVLKVYFSEQNLSDLPESR